MQPAFIPISSKINCGCLACFRALGFGCLLFASVLIGQLECLPLLSLVKNVTHFSTYQKLNQSWLACAYFPAQNCASAAGYLLQVLIRSSDCLAPFDWFCFTALSWKFSGGRYNRINDQGRVVRSWDLMIGYSKRNRECYSRECFW